MTMPLQATEVLDFWFGPPDGAEYGRPRAVWFRKNPQFDALVGDRFGPLLATAARGELGDWSGSPESLLALIVVLDQFPRNIFRGKPQSFATDPAALAAANTMVERQWDWRLVPVMRMFAYLPFEHSERQTDQDRCVALMQRVLEDAQLADMPAWAIKHQAVIARFGRFPHRNAILGRQSTSDELEFLAQPGSSF